MGIAIGGIAIKTESKEFNAESIIEHFFGSCCREVKEEELNTSKFDNREKGHVSVYKTQDFTWLINSEIAEWFFKDNDVKQSALFQFFDKPNLVFAFCRYDGGDTYGYSIFKKGKRLRTYLVGVDKVIIDKGLRLEEEMQWYNSPTEIESLGYGEYQKNYINEHQNRRIVAEHSLPQVLLDDLMFSYLRVYSDDLYSESFQKKFYIIENKKTEKVSWWKRVFKRLKFKLKK